MEEHPLVSIVIPCFNSEKWISETLSSVFSQTYTNIEVIVVDDGSIDRTKEIVLGYNKPVSYYYQKNKGPSVARNVGIKKAKGKYVAFLDSDDLWEKDKLNKQVNYLENNKDVHLVFSNVTLINEKGEHLGTHINQVPTEKEELIKKFFLGQISMNTPTIVARKNSVLKIGGFDQDLPRREDHYFLMRMADKYKIVHFKEPLVKRRISDESMSNAISDERILELNKPFVLKSVDKFSFLKKYEKKFYSKLNSIIGRYYWKKDHYTKGFKFMMKSIYGEPFKFRNYVILLLILLRFKYENIESMKQKKVSSN